MRTGRVLGYLEAMDLMMAHWPEDRKCKCDPVLSGIQLCPLPQCTTHGPDQLCEGKCYQYCWVQQVYQEAATKAGEVRE